MSWFHGEPTLDEMLSGPTVIALMKCDGVKPGDLRVLLRDMSRRLDCRPLSRAAPRAMPRLATRHALRQHHPA
jgi:hypothetical protein